MNGDCDGHLTIGFSTHEQTRWDASIMMAYAKRIPPEREIKYLDGLVRGIYAVRDLPEGHVVGEKDIYLSIPLQKGQISCRELFFGEKLTRSVKADGAITIDHMDTPYSQNPELRQLIMNRGI
jgi:N-acetylneuraminate synthase